MSVKPVVPLTNPEKLVFDDKRKVLKSMNLIKETICENIKGENLRR